MAERCPLVPQLEIAAHASEHADVGKEEPDAHGRGTLAEAKEATKLRVPFWDGARFAPKRQVVSSRNGAPRGTGAASGISRIPACFNGARRVARRVQ